jgi:hypothetical protein
MIEFKRKYSMQNGNKVTKNNWPKVIAISSKPCTNVHGVPAIEAAKVTGSYFEKWKLVYEQADSAADMPAGYIFREINHNGGINGRHKTFKEAIWWAIKYNHIRVMLEI